MSTPTYRQSNEHFTYNNANPKNSKSSGDCVVRAIALGTGKSWDEVFEALCTLGMKLKAMPNDDKVYNKYLEQLGYTKLKQPRKSDNTKYTVKEFASKARKGDVYIINVANHLTCVMENKVQDTWDCGYKCVGNYWKIR